MDPGELKRAAELINDNRDVMIFGHQWPDGDAIGSLLGLGIALSGKGHRVQASWPAPLEVPHKYEFLPGQDLLVNPERLEPRGMAIAVDCANADRLQELGEVALGATGLVNIDHHPDNSCFGTVNIVDTSASATSEIVARNATVLGLKVERESAVCLYTGIVTDTGRFQFTNTTGRTLRTASELVSMGVVPNGVYENVYQCDSLQYIRLAGQVLSNTVYDAELGLVYGCVLQADLNSFGVKMNETEELIDDMRALKGHRVAALFKELADGSVRVSLRSRLDCDIGTVARRLGGGGHRVAAGYTSSKGTVEEAISELKEEIVASSGSSGC